LHVRVGRKNQPMRRSKLQEALEAGESIAGVFAPVTAGFETPAVLTWTPERGALLQLTSLDDAWPQDFDAHFTVHGSLHEYPEPVTLMDSRVTRKLTFEQPARVAAQTLAIGTHTDQDELWPVANYSPSGLHEWYPETGLSIDHPDEDFHRPRVLWTPPRPVTIPVPGGEIQLNPGADWSWGFGPSWHIDTTMKFTVRPEQPLTLREYWQRFRSPLLGFVVFASDRPDDLTWESFYNPDLKRQIIVLRDDHHSYNREWRPNDGHFLFKAADLDNKIEALQRWLAVWRKSEPSLALFIDTIQQGNHFTPSRFLTLYTAAEGYWKSTKRDHEKQWGIDALQQRAGVDERVTHADKQARALIGAARDYQAHLRLPGHLTAKQVDNGTFDSTRRLHAVLQACLLREIGIETDQIEDLMALHYRSWPVP
jgi:hypothetical protein